MPQISGYGKYESDNYGVNCLKVDFDNLTLWYSYRIVIAYRAIGENIVIRENSWSTTTGKHLNWIDDDKSKRIDSNEFEKLLSRTLKAFGLSSQ